MVTISEPPPPPAVGCIPSLLSPVSGAVVDNGCQGFTDLMTWEFAWSACPSAESYHLWVQKSGAAKAVVDNATLTAATYREESRSYVADGNRSDWRWRVRSRQQGNWGDWTPERSFDVEPLDNDCPQGPVGLPQQLAPADGSVFSHYPRNLTLTWAPAAGAARYAVEVDCYHCCGLNQWCADVGRSWWLESSVNPTSYSLVFAGAQAGRWRVWAIDAAGRQGPKTGWWEFRFTV